MRLHRLLNPRSIAVIGGKEAERVVEQCDKFGFSGDIWPVHPTREEIGGRRCFRSIDDLPKAPDAAYVAVNRERTIDIVASLSRRGAGGAVCYAAGFAEADGESRGAKDLQARLVEAAGKMPIIGPNCYGFINALEGVALWPDQHGAVRCESGVAILTQSSNIAISMTMQTRGLPVAYVMTVGNQAQTGLSEIAPGLIEDERVTTLGLHIEGLDDVKAFERLAFRARKLGKPIVAIKVGKTERAQKTALTHTASLAGSDAAHDALFKRLGVVRVETLDAFLETLKLLHCGGPLAGNEILSVSCSGGEAALMADAAEGRDVVYRPFDETAEAALKAELGGIVTIANPLDYNTFIWGDWPAMQRMFSAALAPGFDLAMLVLDFPRGDRCDAADWDRALEVWLAAAGETGARTAVVATMAENMPEEVAKRLMETGVAPLCGMEKALAAVEAAATIRQSWKASLAAPILTPKLHCHSRNSGNPGRKAPKPNTELGLDPRWREDDKGEFVVLDEHASKAELTATGTIVPKGVVVTNEIDAKAAVARLNIPLALKALGISHKTEAGGVRLGLSSADEITRAMREMANLADHFLLEEMVPKPLAELIVGVTRDPVCGLLLTIAAGGVLAELLDDKSHLLLPATESDIRDALSSLKIGKMLDGYRSTDAADIDALVANILCIAKYAEANVDTLEELDVNPLFAMQFGSIAVDALIVKRKTP